MGQAGEEVAVAAAVEEPDTPASAEDEDQGLEAETPQAETDVDPEDVDPEDVDPDGLQETDEQPEFAVV